MRLVEIVDALGKSLVPLLQRLANIGKPRINVPPHVFHPFQQQLVPFYGLGLHSTKLLTDNGVRVTQLFQRRIDVDD